MALIRPCADLRNNYNDISKICHETRQPIFITKNGYNDLVVLSDDLYEEMIENNSKKIDKLISEKFDKQYKDFKDFQKDFFKKIDIGLKDLKDGNFQSLESFCKEMEEKYDFKWILHLFNIFILYIFHCNQNYLNLI